MIRAMERDRLPLLLASPRFADANATEPLDRIRMQKGVFLLQQRGPTAWHDLFRFRPYDWGPYSADLAGRLVDLTSLHLLEREEVPGRRYQAYVTTATGEHVVDEEIVQMPEPHAEFIRRVRSFVTTRPFAQLLRDVYAAFPAYAVNSRFQG